jgi:hypothetical protein
LPPLAINRVFLATVTASNGDILTVQGRAGAVAVHLNNATRVLTPGPANRDQIAVGARLVVVPTAASQANGQGDLTAAVVLLFPAA